MNGHRKASAIALGVAVAACVTVILGVTGVLLVEADDQQQVIEALADDLDDLRVAYRQETGLNPPVPPASVTIEEGRDGRDGTNGRDGRDGRDGEGSVGPQGEAGPQGPAGPPGESVTGPQGPQGEPGESVTGPQGPAGETGAQGAPGATGVTVCPSGSTPAPRQAFGELWLVCVVG